MDMPEACLIVDSCGGLNKRNMLAMGSGIWTLDPEWVVLFGEVVEPLGGGAWRLEGVSQGMGGGRLWGLVTSVHSQVTHFTSLCVAEMWSLCSVIQPPAAFLPIIDSAPGTISQNILFFKLLLAMGLCHSNRNVADKIADSDPYLRLAIPGALKRTAGGWGRENSKGTYPFPLLPTAFLFVETFPVATHWLPVCGVLQAYHWQSFLPSAVAKSNCNFPKCVRTDQHQISDSYSHLLITWHFKIHSSSV